MGSGKSKPKKKEPVAATQAVRPKSPLSAPSAPATSSNATAPPTSSEKVAASPSADAPVEVEQQAPEPKSYEPNLILAIKIDVSRFFSLKRRQFLKTQAKAPEPTAGPDGDLLTLDAHEIASDLFSIFSAFQVLTTEFAAPNASFGTDEHSELLRAKHEKFLDAVEPMVNPAKLAMWIRPLHPYQTGMVASRAVGVRTDVENLKFCFSTYEKEFKTNSSIKQSLRECYKNLLSNLFYVYGGIEVAFPEYLASQVDNTSIATQQCLESALKNELGQYENAYRLAITETIKLARIANTKGFQTSNVDVQKEISDSAFTSIRATSILTNIGRSYLQENNEAEIAKMGAIAKGLVSQYSKINELAKIQEVQTDSLFTPETIAQYHAAFDSACKLLDDSCNQYRQSAEPDETMLNILQQLMLEVPTFKEVLTSPNTKNFAQSVFKITRLVQILAIHVSSLLAPDMDASIYHMVLNGLFASLHYVIQLNIASISKCLYHPVVPPELTVLNSIRLLFGTLGVVLVNACPVLSSGPTSSTEDNYDTLELLTPSSSVPHPSITDILHYGRPLIIREEPKVPVKAGASEPETVNSILKDLEDDIGLTSTEPTPQKVPEVKQTPSKNPLGEAPTLTITPTKPKQPESKPKVNTTPVGTRPSLMEFSRDTGPRDPTKARPSDAPIPNKNPLGAAPTVAVTTSNTPAAVTPKKPEPEPQPSSSSTTTSAAAGSLEGAAGAPPGAPTPWTTIPADQIDENNLPPGYPTFPPKVGAFQKGGGEEAYKQWMVDRYNREAAENALIVYKRKLKAAQESVGIK